MKTIIKQRVEWLEAFYRKEALKDVVRLIDELKDKSWNRKELIEELKARITG